MNIKFRSKRIYFVKPMIKFAEFYANNINDIEVYRWLDTNGKQYSIEDEIKWIKRSKNEPVYAMVTRDNEMIGNINFTHIKDDTGEIGIWITPSMQNNHYGREAIERFIKYGFNKMNMNTIYIRVYENNKRAIKCYKSVGFKQYKKQYNKKDGIGNKTNIICMKIEKER